MRKIIHVDMDAFFASVEQRDNPAYRGKPVIVGAPPDMRGVVSASSYEARKFGVHSAMPSRRAYELCPHGIFLPVAMERYRDESRALYEIFRRFSRRVEMASVDEAYIDVTENLVNQPSATLIAMAIRKTIKDERRLTASAGVSFNKFLAKMASERRKPDGLSIIPPAAAKEFLAGLDIGKFHGIGKVTANKFRRIGVRTGADLLRLDIDFLTNSFGKAGAYYYNVVRGVDEREVETSNERKSLGRETTFLEDVDNVNTIRQTVVQLAERVSQLLKTHNLAGHTVTLKLRYDDFETLTRAHTGADALCDSVPIAQTALTLLNKLELAGRKVRLLGVTVSSFAHEKPLDTAPIQLEFDFDPPPEAGDF